MPKPAKNLELSNIILAQKESQLKDQLDTRMSVKRIPVIGRDLFWPVSFFTWLHGLLKFAQNALSPCKWSENTYFHSST